MLNETVTRSTLPRGLDAAWSMGVGVVKRFVPRKRLLLRRAEKVLQRESTYSGMKGDALRESAQRLRERFRRSRDTEEDLEDAFALVREVAHRQLGEKPFLVQVAGALALESGCVLEMATGEGKTLTASLVGTVEGWRGRGCHIVTVNDYLARRDAEWMGRIYKFCGVSVGSIQQTSSPDERRAAYAADVTYCTNKEVSADFLRDRLAMGRIRSLSSALISRISGTGGRRGTERLIQRGLNFAVVDEADSILIDEAVTPLIISGSAPNEEQLTAFQIAAEMGGRLEKGRDYRVLEKYREVEITELGEERLLTLAAEFRSTWKGKRRCREMVKQALTARELFHRDQQYVVKSGKVVIVDDFTGRLMPDRTWRDGLHQAVEAKEGLQVTPPKDTYARISFQRFFRMYRKLSGMTGTAKEATPEFWQIYNLPVAQIPTNRSCRRSRLPALVFAGDDEKWRHVVDMIAATHATGRPVLVGTRSVQASEKLSALLWKRDLHHRVLNAVKHEEEAQIIARAGLEGRITVATNMAGRGTDIKLGEGVAERGGLHVIAAEPNESARIDRQLFGRGARQGDPGSAQLVVSLEDEIVSRYMERLSGFVKKRGKKVQKGSSSFLVRTLVYMAQRRAEKLALRRRKSVLQTDHWLDEQLGFAGSE